MPLRGHRFVIGLGSLLGSCLLGAGCDTLPHLPMLARRAEPQATQPAQTVSWRERVTAPFHHSQPSWQNLLQPQSVVYWSAAPGAGAATGGYRGRSTVNTNGDIHLGPYGDVHVAGLTPEQAKAAVVRQVAYQVRDPQVSLSLNAPA